jgi:5-methylcytosine-specific restriction endonuclease McrA
MLAELGGYGHADLRDIQYELALAQRATAYTCRGQINWGRHFPWLKVRLSEAQNHRCCWCHKLMDDTGPRDDRPTFEHIIPLSRCGEDAPANLAIACYRCNQDRGNEPFPPSPTTSLSVRHTGRGIEDRLSLATSLPNNRGITAIDRQAKPDRLK